MNITEEQSLEAFREWAKSQPMSYIPASEAWQAAIRFAQGHQDPWAVSPEVAEAILLARDAYYHGELSEAYHQLYRIADPEFSSLEPWERLEKIAGDRRTQGHLTTPPKITFVAKDQLP